MTSQFDPYTRWSAITVTAVAALGVITKLLNANVNATFSVSHLKRARLLVSQAIYWHDTSEQDTNPLFAMKHADYAIAYLNAARSMLPDNILERTCNVDIYELSNSLETHQRQKTKSVTEICPTSNPEATKTKHVNWMKL